MGLFGGFKAVFNAATSGNNKRLKSSESENLNVICKSYIVHSEFLDHNNTPSTNNVTNHLHNFARVKRPLPKIILPGISAANNSNEAGESAKKDEIKTNSEVEPILSEIQNETINLNNQIDQKETKVKKRVKSKNKPKKEKIKTQSDTTLPPTENSLTTIQTKQTKSESKTKSKPKDTKPKEKKSKEKQVKFDPKVVNIATHSETTIVLADSSQTIFETMNQQANYSETTLNVEDEQEAEEFKVHIVDHTLKPNAFFAPSDDEDDAAPVPLPRNYTSQAASIFFGDDDDDDENFKEIQPPVPKPRQILFNGTNDIGNESDASA